MTNLVYTGNTLDWKRFEKFNALFVQLRYWAWHFLGRSPVVPLSHWFPGAHILDGADIVIPEARKLGLRPDMLGATVKVAARSLTPGDTVLLKACNPGVDMLDPLASTEATRPSVIATQDKWSDVGDSKGGTATRLDKLSLWRSVRKTEEELENSSITVQERKIKPSSAVYVMVAHRDTTLDVHKFGATLLQPPPKSANQGTRTAFNEFKKRKVMAVVVLDRQSVFNFVGPTFSSLAGFSFGFDARETLDDGSSIGDGSRGDGDGGGGGGGGNSE